MIRSLRGRLFVGLTTMIVVAGAIGAIFTYKWAFDEAIEIQDSALIEIASLAQNGGLNARPPVPEIEENAMVRLIDLGENPRGTPEERRLFELKDGLHTANWKGQSVRALLGTRLDGSRYAAAQPTAVRDDTAADMAVRTRLPIVALIPCLLIVTGLIVTHSLRPVIRLAGDLDARRADDLEALQEAHAPEELKPFITSTNGLLRRMQLLFDQRRRFVADAAHELRTPIAALTLQIGNLETIELPEQARSRVVALKEGMYRTKHLLEQLLAVARYEATPVGDRLRHAPLDATARDVAAELLPRALDRNISLGFERIEPIAVQGEPAMLASMIRNLLDNALRHTPDGGRIDVGLYREDGSAVLQIEDSGPGIPADDLKLIFEPFFRGSRPQGEGAGLGLSIVKRIVDQLGGGITLENTAGRDQSGVRATIRLPLAAA